MDLDNIKKVWKAQQTASFSREEILAMLQKKSSSIAKWIFYIGLAEFAFWLMLSFVLPESSLELNKNSKLFIEILSYVNYAIIIGFIAIFFINFRKIKAEENITQLLKNIFRTRKTVQYYIVYNLSMFVFSFILIVVWLMTTEPEFLKISEQMRANSIFWIGFIFGILIFMVIILTILYFFYRLLYGFLLRRLNNNYKEIQQLQ